MKQILVIEDDRDIQANLKELLEDEGYAVTCMFNGHEAVEYLKRRGRQPDLILLDLMMPICDGYAFREFQTRDPLLAAIPVRLMTAAAGVDLPRLLLGPGEVIRKPIDVDTLLGVLGQALARIPA